MKKRVIMVVVFCISFLFGGKGVVPVPLSIATVEVPEEEIHFYLGLGVSAISTRDGSTSMNIVKVKDNQDRLGNISFLGGYDFNEYIGIEGRYIRELQDQHRVKMNGFNLSLKPQFRLPFLEELNIYGLLGVGQVALTGVKGNRVDFDKLNFQFGGGINYRIQKNIDLVFDYIDLASERSGTYWNGASTVSADMFTAGTVYRF